MIILIRLEENYRGIRKTNREDAKDAKGLKIRRLDPETGSG